MKFMIHTPERRGQYFCKILCLIGFVVSMGIHVGCSTTPKPENQPTFRAEASAATEWFENQVIGVSDQIRKSAGYIIFPSVSQWGTIYTGGKFGRGMVHRSDGTQIGWAALNTFSLGLQAGVQGFKMLVVLEDQATLQTFMNNRLSGSVTGVFVAAEYGLSKTVPFENGVAVYQGAHQGLMAGVNMGLDTIRHAPLEDAPIN